MKSLLTVFALAMVMFVSCNNEIENAEEPMQGEEVTVKIGFDGEILDITEGPLETKVSGDDLYGVQVYCISSSGYGETPYAYGLFNDPSKMEIKLIKGYKYCFKATMIENGINIVYHLNNEDGVFYSNPFTTILNNSFIYSTNESIDVSESGVAINDESASYFRRASLMRYYGLLANYVPDQANSNLTIELYKVIFGAKFKIENFKEGKISININMAPEMIITYPDTETENIFTFGEFWSYYDSLEGHLIQEEILTVGINWIQTDGTTIPVYNGPIKFTRNKQTIVTINLDQESESLGTKVEIDLEDTPITPGEEVTINPGDQVAG